VRRVAPQRSPKLTAAAQAAAQAYGRALSRAFKQHAELFREWGATGGKTRARKLTAEERREIARKAARARWSGKRKPTA
jgi:hypothetical protein